ncbi:MAG: hypothetical protein IOC80_03315 [Rhodobacter sp.]|nr:hypothetical protein [Rhodobacter sp.]MCA3774277.1 hypothetical protein [Cutibacterium sp.]MCA3518877.1 hypothetical protein [Rhodobacter sp.]MCA3527585.1 hypothetical protein [Rhodobacter sp.]MCA3530482.1 hypothetical protein [Rhodobacter sp.]
MAQNVVVLLDNPEGRSLVREECIENKISFPEFVELIQAEVEQTGKQRKRGLFDSFDDILDRIELGD